MCIEQLKNLLNKNKLMPPQPLIDISHTEVLTKLRSELGTDCKIYLSDHNYQTTNLSELTRFLTYDNTDKYVYKSEYLDCDDFSYRLHGQLSIPGWSGLVFGILWIYTGTGGHAVNIFMDTETTIWIVEPQSDKIFRIPLDWTPWVAMI